MGQTLTHGIYLPDEGERNCYSGLAANWQILDNSVGTIAAHTAALAGKAPLVHTHTKSDITDFPAYGTAAGTICEGNDSRLSDARTPVAHTHGKADITDLFNSANTWTGDNTFSDSVLISSSQNKYLRIKNTSWDLGQSIPATSMEFGGITFRDKDDENIGYIIPYDYTTGNTVIRFLCRQKYTNNARDPNGTSKDSNLYLGVSNTGIKYIETDGYIRNALVPFFDNYYNLGTSTAKWKTLNGINPGALSLPDYSRTMDIDTTNWSKNGGKTIFTPTLSGWLQITIPNDVDSQGNKSNYISLLDSGTNPISGMANGNTNDARIFLLFPVIATREYWIYIKSYSNTITTARIVQCQGNV